MSHRPRRWRTVVLTACGCLMASAALALQIREYNSGIAWEEPKVIDPGPLGGPPSDATVLFDGKDLSAWNGAEKWGLEDGVAVARSAVSTKQPFGDCQLHLEYAAPTPPKGKGQQRGNNGIKFMGRYEVQILDSYDNKTYLDGMCGSIYKQRPPLVNACRPPGEWQTFDIVFEAPRFDMGGKLARPAYLTVFHNGVLLHNRVELEGATAYDRPPAYRTHPEKLPLVLAYHGDPVRFRNIWVREIRDLEAKRPSR